MSVGGRRSWTNAAVLSESDSLVRPSVVSRPHPDEAPPVSALAASHAICTLRRGAYRRAIKALERQSAETGDWETKNCARERLPPRPAVFDPAPRETWR